MVKILFSGRLYFEHPVVPNLMLRTLRYAMLDLIALCPYFDDAAPFRSRRANDFLYANPQFSRKKVFRLCFFFFFLITV